MARAVRSPSTASGAATLAGVAAWMRKAVAISVPDSPGTISQCTAAVHDLRVAVKKLRAVNRLIQPLTGRTQACAINSRLRNLSRNLAPARDLEVLQRTVEKLNVPGSATRKLQQRWKIESREALPSANTLRSVATRLQKIAVWIENRLKSTGMETDVAGKLYKRVKKSWKRARHRYQACTPCPVPEAMHEWRKAIKRLLYQCAARSQRRSSLRSLEKLEADLGHCNDLNLLRTALGNLPEESSIATAKRIVNRRLRKEMKKNLARGRRQFKRPCPF